ncbi:MAG: hypothetical protein AVDCRST_MAG25-1212 [uncultured Rubrobacteraceae bacterium]|uniref:Uncharacterized protein n=1 Tax=uncultured Rubrobacteraceae bacterium TaxID=349277 RepID=A0A6J4RAF8_9ACTN|nr:MAG: hypothetical protein AVDCRST_MAG25-1212 [uncultured Rubrobacteraceae bacterium]
MDLMHGGALEAAAWKIKNLPDYEARLERAARRMDELGRGRGAAALVIYETALMGTGRPVAEVREKVRAFKEAFEDDEEELTIPRASAIMNVEDDSWFFGDERVKVMTGQLLGQFQHRVTQYNYVDENEVLRRWADSYDTRLFIRRRIHETEPIAGVVSGFELPLIQYLRVAAGGDTVVPTPAIARVLRSLGAVGEGEAADDYAVLGAAEGLALRLELPAPIAGELLSDLAEERDLEFPEPPAAVAEETGSGAEDEATAGVTGTGGTDADAEKPSPDDRASRRAARESAARGEEPTRVQDPQAKDAPGTREEAGEKPEATPPRTGTKDAPGAEQG